MKKVFILLIVTSLFIVVIKAKAFSSQYDEIAKSSKADVTIYAKKMNDIYTDFKIDFQGSKFFRSYWVNTTNPIWSPQIFYEDINNDKKNELIIILTKGYGTGILKQEVHVFHIQKQGLKNKFIEVPVEVLVDEPIAIILKNVKTNLSPTEATVSIGDKKYIINIKHLSIPPEHLFENIYFGNIINFEIKDNQLIAKIGGQISPAGGYIGDLLITYMFKDDMYQAKSIEFILYEN